MERPLILPVRRANQKVVIKLGTAVQADTKHSTVTMKPDCRKTAHTRRLAEKSVILLDFSSSHGLMIQRHEK